MSTYRYGILHCVAKIIAIITFLLHVKTYVEAPEMIQSCRVVHSINREKPHQSINYAQFFSARIQSEDSNQNYISCEIVFLNSLGCTSYKRKIIVFSP